MVELERKQPLMMPFEKFPPIGKATPEEIIGMITTLNVNYRAQTDEIRSQQPTPDDYTLYIADRLQDDRGLVLAEALVIAAENPKEPKFFTTKPHPTKEESTIFSFTNTSDIKKRPKTIIRNEKLRFPEKITTPTDLTKYLNNNDKQSAITQEEEVSAQVKLSKNSFKKSINTVLHTYQEFHTALNIWHKGKDETELQHLEKLLIEQVIENLLQPRYNKILPDDHDIRLYYIADLDKIAVLMDQPTIVQSIMFKNPRINPDKKIRIPFINAVTALGGIDNQFKDFRTYNKYVSTLHGERKQKKTSHR